MEKRLNSSLGEIMSTEGVRGLVVSDKHGLCIAARGSASEESSGIWTALLTQASKLEPDLSTPTLVLENATKQCVVQGNDKLVISVYKDRR